LTMGKKFLVITSQVAGIGDIILSLPFFRALRDNFPSAYLTLMVNPNTVGIMKGNPYFNEIIVYNKKDNLKRKWRFIQSLREKKFDKVVCLSECFSSLLIAYLSGAREKVGFDWKGRGTFLSVSVPYEKPEKKHLGEIFADLAQALGLEHYRKDLKLWISEEERGGVKKFFEKEKVKDNFLKVVIHPGAGWVPRQWPGERFAAIADRLVEAYKAKVFVVGGDDDSRLVDKMISSMTGKAISCVGRLSIREAAALIEACDLFIGNDSGLMHVAAAVHTPVIALFGPGNVARVGLRGDRCVVVRKDLSCSPCVQYVHSLKCVKGEPVCMKMITVDDVWQAVERIVSNK